MFRQTASAPTWIGVAMGFAGIVLVLGPHHDSFNIGALIALAGALFLAIALMSIRWLGATEPRPRILFYYFLLSTVMALPVAALDWQPFMGPAWLYLLGIGCALLLSQMFIVRAYRYASSVKLGPLVYTVIVFSALIEWAVWKHSLRELHTRALAFDEMES